MVSTFAMSASAFGLAGIDVGDSLIVSVRHDIAARHAFGVQGCLKRRGVDEKSPQGICQQNAARDDRNQQFGDENVQRGSPVVVPLASFVDRSMWPRHFVICATNDG